MNLKLRTAFSLLVILMILGCEKSSNTLIDVPSVLLDCQISECNGTIGVGNALVLLSQSGCENDFEVPAAATPSITCGGSGCSGAAANWVDSGGNVVTEIFTGSYDLCVLIDRDLSGNTSYTAGDIVYEESIRIDSSSPISASGSSWRVVN